MNYCMIEVAFDNEKNLNICVEELLDKHLVSSCQVVNSNSIWRWHGVIENAKEYLLLLKTKESLVHDIYELLKKYHSYETFEFAVFNITSPSKDYLEWIDKETV